MPVVFAPKSWEHGWEEIRRRLRLHFNEAALDPMHRPKKKKLFEPSEFSHLHCLILDTLALRSNNRSSSSNSSNRHASDEYAKTMTEFLEQLIAPQMHQTLSPSGLGDTMVTATTASTRVDVPMALTLCQALFQARDQYQRVQRWMSRLFEGAWDHVGKQCFELVILRPYFAEIALALMHFRRVLSSSSSSPLLRQPPQQGAATNNNNTNTVEEIALIQTQLLALLKFPHLPPSPHAAGGGTVRHHRGSRRSLDTNNNEGVMDWDAFAAFLERSERRRLQSGQDLMEEDDDNDTTSTTLTLRYIPLKATLLQALMDLQSLQHITALELIECPLEMENSALLTTAVLAPAHCPLLERLSLVDCCCSSEDGSDAVVEHLDAVLPAVLTVNPRLHHLSLGKRQMTPQTLGAVTRQLCSFGHHHSASLKTLELSWNSSLFNSAGGEEEGTVAAVTQLAMALQQGTVSGLETLDMEGCGSVSVTTALTLFRAILQSPTSSSLRSFGLSGMWLHRETASSSNGGGWSIQARAGKDDIVINPTSSTTDPGQRHIMAHKTQFFMACLGDLLRSENCCASVLSIELKDCILNADDENRLEHILGPVLGANGRLTRLVLKNCGLSTTTVQQIQGAICEQAGNGALRLRHVALADQFNMSMSSCIQLMTLLLRVCPELRSLNLAGSSHRGQNHNARGEEHDLEWPFNNMPDHAQLTLGRVDPLLQALKVHPTLEELGWFCACPTAEAARAVLQTMRTMKSPLVSLDMQCLNLCGAFGGEVPRNDNIGFHDIGFLALNDFMAARGIRLGADDDDAMELEEDVGVIDVEMEEPRPLRPPQGGRRLSPDILVETLFHMPNLVRLEWFRVDYMMHQNFGAQTIIPQMSGLLQRNKLMAAARQISTEVFTANGDANPVADRGIPVILERLGCNSGEGSPVFLFLRQNLAQHF